MLFNSPYFRGTRLRSLPLQDTALHITMQGSYHNEHTPPFCGLAPDPAITTITLHTTYPLKYPTHHAPSLWSTLRTHVLEHPSHHASTSWSTPCTRHPPLGAPYANCTHFLEHPSPCHHPMPSAGPWAHLLFTNPKSKKLLPRMQYFNI